jgi:hypothetical protein
MTSRRCIAIQLYSARCTIQLYSHYIQRLYTLYNLYNTPLPQSQSTRSGPTVCGHREVRVRETPPLPYPLETLCLAAFGRWRRWRGAVGHVSRLDAHLLQERFSIFDPKVPHFSTVAALLPCTYFSAIVLVTRYRPAPRAAARRRGRSGRPRAFFVLVACRIQYCQERAVVEG